MPSIETTPEFEALLAHLKHHYGCDLTGYKRSTLIRRFQHRMQSIEVRDYETYTRYLQHHPEEYQLLLKDVFINYTTFFRDRDAWDYLATTVLPEIIEKKQPDEPIRIWSAGCAAGQEMYSVLILLAEALGIESCLQRVQCFATDVDDEALQFARRGIYHHSELANVPPDLLEKYFQQTEDGYGFLPALRRTIVFGTHDLVQHAPMSKIDLLMCRNVLIYFNLEVQTSILVRFHFALKNPGFLFLGKSETITNRRQIFTPVNLKQKIYQKGLNLELQDHLSINPKSRKQEYTDPVSVSHEFWQTAFETSPIPQCMINSIGRLIDANEQARLLFGFTINDRNHSFQKLEAGQSITSQTAETCLHRKYQPTLLKNIKWATSENVVSFDIQVNPVFNSKNRLLGTLLTFLDISKRI